VHLTETDLRRDLRLGETVDESKPQDRLFALRQGPDVGLEE